MYKNYYELLFIKPQYTVFCTSYCFALFSPLHILLLFLFFLPYICSCVVLLLYNFYFYSFALSTERTCHGSHGDPGTRRRGLWQTRYLMNDKRRLHRNTGKNIQTALTHDINNNPQQTWGRTDYIKGDITGNTWDTIKTQTKTNQLMMGNRKNHIRVRRQR